MLEPLQTEGGKGGAMSWMGEKPMFWSECLELAVAFGWRPAGILYPMTGLEVFEDKPEEFAKEGGANGSGMERTLETPSSLAAFFVSQRKREGARRRGEICSRRLNDRMKLTVVRGEARRSPPRQKSWAAFSRARGYAAGSAAKAP